MILQPALLLRALLEAADVRWGTEAQVDLTARTVNGEAFDAVVLASGWQMQAALPWLRLAGRAGQVEWMQSAVEAAPSALVSRYYALAAGRMRLWGATFGTHQGAEVQPSETGHAENMAALLALQPDWLGEIERVEILSRAGVRASAPDRLPVIGRLVDYEAALVTFGGLRHGQPVADRVPEIDGVYLAGGFGARGFTWGPWAGAVLAAQVFGDPVPATAGGLQAVAPVRQILRDLKRGGVV
ncbi:MAG: FAD-dependent oxidoreductase [Henriciella sp.]|nr:FAD-dependent oxidoreductase [Henriciella sp.]